MLGIVASLGLLNWSGNLQTHPLRAALVVLTVACANWSWNLTNEYMDYKRGVDQKNKPWKPLPSGQVTLYGVQKFSYILFWTSICINIGLVVFFDWVYLVGFLGHVTSAVYNMVRKDLLGNLCMAATYGIAAFISLYPNNLFFSLAFATLTLSFNLNTQYQDLDAEKTRGVVTFPHQIDNLNMLNAVLVLETVWLVPFVLFLIMYSNSGYMPLLVFAVTSLIIMVAGHSVFLGEEEKFVENLTRRLGRLLLLIGFLTMLLTSYIM